MIHNKIWKKSEGENKKTLRDIRDKRQIIPGVITRDGIVVDGNRRFMIARKLNEEGLNRQFLTVILDDTYEDGGDNELQIKKLETEIQLGRDERARVPERRAPSRRDDAQRARELHPVRPPVLLLPFGSDKW